jgi:uncharacterized membrane protein (DUF4010 family)
MLSLSRAMEGFSDSAFALLIGLLLGLERERSESDRERFAGIRTFPLLSLAGCVAALVGRDGPALLLPAVVIGLAALVVSAYHWTAAVHHGVTSEALALLAPLLGALCGYGRGPLAASLAVIVTLLLALKAPLHRFVGALTEEEVLSILKFGIVAVVALPLLPTREVGPYGAIVPRHVGMVVVVICGLSLLGYVLVRLLGGRTGWALAGLVGGLVSSTAVTLALSGKARELKHLLRSLAAGILLASMVLNARGLVLAAVFDPPFARYLLPRLGTLFFLAAAFAARELLKKEGAGEKGEVGLGNPVELTRAVGLGLLFAGILVVARAAQEELGTAGLWAAGALGGLLDVDSVLLANAGLRKSGVVTAEAAGGSFLLATLTNLAVKSGIVTVVGGRGLAARVLPGFAAVAVVTVVFLVLR